MNAPLLFTPRYANALWGGSRIAARFNRTDAPVVCSESWEISGHPACLTPVAEGPFAGRTLDALARACGVTLVGTRAPDPTRFPLLFKIIDATRDLSVQVHPGEAVASRLGGEPKDEAWLVLDAVPGALLYAGVRPGTQEADFRAAAETGRGLDALLARHAVRPGDLFPVPGGTVHALGAGCLVYEVQQSSNTTYRLHDWGRVDADGRPRPLHVPQALAAVDYALPPTECRRGSVDTPHFHLRELELSPGDEHEFQLDGTTFVVLFAIEGEVDVAARGGRAHLKHGGSGLVPAAAGFCRLEARSRARLAVTTL